jgi:hypothetical protein
VTYRYIRYYRLLLAIVAAVLAGAMTTALTLGLAHAAGSGNQDNTGNYTTGYPADPQQDYPPVGSGWVADVQSKNGDYAIYADSYTLLKQEEKGLTIIDEWPISSQTGG